jgi:hypothetical protein
VITRRNASEGYLLAWVGALVGLLVGGAIPVLLLSRFDIVGCPGSFDCGFWEGLGKAVIGVAAIFGGAIGAPVGTYAGLRLAGRAFAGLTGWMFVSLYGVLVVANRLVGSVFVATDLGFSWVLALLLLVFTAPLISRRLALLVAGVLREFR